MPCNLSSINILRMISHNQNYLGIRFERLGVINNAVPQHWEAIPSIVSVAIVTEFGTTPVELGVAHNAKVRPRNNGLTTPNVYY